MTTQNFRVVVSNLWTDGREYRCRIVPAGPSILRKRPRWAIALDEMSGYPKEWRDAYLGADLRSAVGSTLSQRFSSVAEAEAAAQRLLDDIEWVPPGERGGIPVGVDPYRAALEELSKLDPVDIQEMP